MPGFVFCVPAASVLVNGIKLESCIALRSISSPSSTCFLISALRSIDMFLSFKVSAKFVTYNCNLLLAVCGSPLSIKFIEVKGDVEILAIGIGHDVSRYYNKAIKITDVHELGDVMISQLSGLFDNKKKLH